MVETSELAKHVEEFEATTGLKVHVHDGIGQVYIVIDKAPLPSSCYRLDKTDVLFVGDAQYPMSALDMFWTELEVIRENGEIPAGADAIETYIDRQWRRFSWHRNGVWNPAGNGLLDHYEFVQARFAEDAAA